MAEPLSQTGGNGHRHHLLEKHTMEIGSGECPQTMGLPWILLYEQALHGVPGFADFCTFHSSNDFIQLSSQGLQSECGKTECLSRNDFVLSASHVGQRHGIDERLGKGKRSTGKGKSQVTHCSCIVHGSALGPFRTAESLPSSAGPPTLTSGRSSHT